MTHFPDKIATN